MNPSDDIDKNHINKTMEFNPDSYCGLYCGACVRYLSTKSNKIHELAIDSGLSPQEFQCTGCKTTQSSRWCNLCAIKECAKKRGLESCVECSEYPCMRIRILQANYCHSHHMDIIDSLNFRKQKGTESWLLHQRINWSCPVCFTEFGIHDKTCINCGYALNKIKIK